MPNILDMTAEAVLNMLSKWYGGYRYSMDTRDPVFNPDMVLYFVRAVTRLKRLPTEMTDQNVRDRCYP